jgi:hypothetical protein
MRKYGRAVWLIALGAIALVACDGEDPEREPRRRTKRSVAAFCERVQQYDDAGDFSDSATKQLYEELIPVAPTQIKGDVQVLLAALDANVLGDERTAAAGDRFTAYVEQGCGIDLVPDAI